MNHSIPVREPRILDSLDHRLQFLGPLKGQAAYHLEHNIFNVDAGENDLRALHDIENGVVKFICRYKEDLPRIEAKIADFASKHSNTGCVFRVY